jgi:hypothetical protein
VDNVRLDLQIAVCEFGGIRTVGVNATHSGGRKKDPFGPLIVEEPLDRFLIGQLQFAMCSGDDMVVTLGPKTAIEGRSDQSTVAGDVDSGIFLHSFLPVEMQSHR